MQSKTTCPVFTLMLTGICGISDTHRHTGCDRDPGWDRAVPSLTLQCGRGIRGSNSLIWATWTDCAACLATFHDLGHEIHLCVKWITAIATQQLVTSKLQTLWTMSRVPPLLSKTKIRTFKHLSETNFYCFGDRPVHCVTATVNPDVWILPYNSYYAALITVYAYS